MNSRQLVMGRPLFEPEILGLILGLNFRAPFSLF